MQAAAQILEPNGFAGQAGGQAVGDQEGGSPAKAKKRTTTFERRKRAAAYANVSSENLKQSVLITKTRQKTRNAGRLELNLRFCPALSRSNVWFHLAEPLDYGFVAA